MATTATPAVAVPTPTPTPAQQTQRGRKGRMTFRVQKLPESLLLEQAVLDPTWNTFKTYFGVCVGGLCFMAWIVYLSFQFGVSRSVVPPPTATVSPQPTVVSVPAPVPSVLAPPVAPAELTPEELDRRHTEYLRRQ